MTIGGQSFRVTPGRKSRVPNRDRRLEWRTSSGWLPVPMAAALAMVDFFAENETALEVERPHWRKKGADYFLGKCREAVRRGWPAVAREIDEQRERLGSVQSLWDDQE